MYVNRSILLDRDINYLKYLLLCIFNLKLDYLILFGDCYYDYVIVDLFVLIFIIIIRLSSVVQ